MSARLGTDMEWKASAIAERAAGYRMAGDRDLAVLAERASAALKLAVARLDELTAAEAVRE